MNIKRMLPASIILVCGAAWLSCGCSDLGIPSLTATPAVTDAQLYDLQAKPVHWVWFGGTADTLTGGSTTAHEDRIRVRYNVYAATKLTDTRRVLAGAVFPDSSLIVKELYTGSVLTTIAYMYKIPGASNAAPGGWVWAETDGWGNPKIPASRAGAGCIGCHASGIDYTRMNDTHP